MVAYNFKKQFAPSVKDGSKTSTIRALRKKGEHAKMGDHLQLYYGMRTKHCRKLLDAVCTGSTPISITEDGIELNQQMVAPDHRDGIAKRDGFESWEGLRDFIAEEHGFPFNGALITW